MRAGRAGVSTGAAISISRRHLALNAGLYAPVAAAVVTVGGAVFVLDLERQAPHANIRTLPDALWWAATTITTVGYGDHYPVTATGRIVAVALMLVGIGLLGVVTATFAAAFVRWAAEPSEPSTTPEQAQLTDVMAELRVLRDQVADIRAHLTPGQKSGQRESIARDLTG